MTVLHSSPADVLTLQQRRSWLVSHLFGPIAIALDIVAILLIAVASGVGWHTAFYGTTGNVSTSLEFGVMTALVFGAISVAHGDYRLLRYLTLKRHASSALYAWTAAFLIVMAFGFFTKTDDALSRGALVVFYLATLGALGVIRLALVRAVVTGAREERIAARRVLLVGAEADVLAFSRRYAPTKLGLKVVGMSVLRRDAAEHRDVDLARAVGTARALSPDDVIIVMPWSANDDIQRAVDAFMNLPVSIQLAPEAILDRFDHVGINKIGPMATLELTRPPLTRFEIVSKRAIDIVGASVGLVLLAPLFMIVAILIKIDSRGPVFFLQQRWGLNQRPFRIVKFRSMTSLDDGAVVRQATRNDARITRIGAFLRRTNIDELPQLVNVLLGQMSIVGPRPHAIAHNRAYEHRIALYARRHNVKPGITGWAQVNGYRGETDTDEKMEGRVAHDLWYIDNWSLLLDLRIILLTFLSRRSFQNAY